MRAEWTLCGKITHVNSLFWDACVDDWPGQCVDEKKPAQGRAKSLKPSPGPEEKIIPETTMTQGMASGGELGSIRAWQRQSWPAA